MEIDLVGHDGGNISGDYIQTLDVTDVCTGAGKRLKQLRTRPKSGYLRH